jgi:hypothetical protein
LRARSSLLPSSEQTSSGPRIRNSIDRLPE